MIKDFDKSLFIFRRDLRLADNTALIQALGRSNEVIACFIIDPRFFDRKRTNFNAIEFMFESLTDLEEQLREKTGELFYFKGKPEEVISRILKENNINAVFTNRDYTPFSTTRDKNIEQICEKKNISFLQFGDQLINEPESFYNTKGEPYTIFTPYYKRASQIQVKFPQKNNHTNYVKDKSIKRYDQVDIHTYLQTKSSSLAFHGGRKECKSLLSKLDDLIYYEKERDYPALNQTSHLSPHLKFGTYSIREVYHIIKTKLGGEHPILRQLYWRDFFTVVSCFYPRVFTKSFRQKYDKLKWSNDKKTFQKWCEGKTGFPIIDAGMRELNETGYMHNRVRMIVASFLTKDMHIDWRWGEKYFAEKLVDFDRAVNNGNWQWAASTGCDAQPYFRIFNPWNQQKKYDKDCEYIKNWVPELGELEKEVIHKWYETHGYFDIGYPAPILNHKKESIIAKNTYRSLSE